MSSPATQSSPDDAPILASPDASDASNASSPRTAERLSSPVKIASGERFRAPARLVGAPSRIESPRAVLMLCGLTLLASWVIFPDVNAWMLAYAALVPWLVAVCTARNAKLVYFASWLWGLGFFLFNLRWVLPLSLPGYLAMCVYSSLFIPLAAWPIRHMYTRHGVSVALTAPIVWVAMEYLRSSGPLAFGWLLLGHTQYQFLSLIQISDLVGVYGVSFLVVMVNGWMTDLLIQPILIWRSDHATRLPLGTLMTLGSLLAALVYGGAASSRKYFEPGPTVAVVQHDFPRYVDAPAPSRLDPELMHAAYLRLVRRAAEKKPDVILLPEAAVHGCLNREFLNASPDDLAEMQRRRFPPIYPRGTLASMQQASRRALDAFQSVVDETGVPILLGSASMEWKPTAIPPRADAYNSAFLLMPGQAPPAARHDKIHLVPFGEFMPFRFSHRWLYDLLNKLTPWGDMGIEYSLSPGEGRCVFEFGKNAEEHRPWRAGVQICYEEIIPYIARGFAGHPHAAPDRKDVDVLFAISNDGWFLHSAELEQHMASAVFRAVENRLPIARAVDTGASAIIHPNGKIHDRTRLTPGQLESLPKAARRLERIEELTRRAEGAIGETDGFIRVREELGRAIGGELRSALAALGAEFEYMAERIDRLSLSLSSPTPQGRAAAVQELSDQLRRDRETMDRWARRPDTAPAISVARLNLDDRLTLYTRWGDWFAQSALALSAMMVLDWFLRKLWRARKSESHTEVAAGAA